MKLAILGAGAWGTALAIVLSQRHQTVLWVWDPDQLAEMQANRSSRFLPNFSLPASVQLHANVEDALAQAELAIVVVPTQGLRQTLKEISASAKPVSVILACKGFEPGSPNLPHQVAVQELAAGTPCAILSGPSFAQEVAQGLPAALTLASNDGAFAQSAAKELHSQMLRVYSSDDVIGVAVGGAVKNVMAIAAGICDGMGLGNNARAALITRGLAEITRLGLKLGGKPETFMGLAGAGDLILTCTGDLSRNRQVGMMLAAGKSLPAILAQLGHVAEGVPTAREVLQLAGKVGVDMPITRAVNQVLYENVPAMAALQELLNRDPKAEF
ncbi:MAG TPA: NAD(P)H-dependent glycerol-3-phosphate dehydrogenase [Burkholderiales bacterium]|nr:NAD(P)H-dependent glycerol-3-phosphate dehydrogenase [Burkholderiales bacterium]